MFDALDDGTLNPFCVFTESISKQVETEGEGSGLAAGSPGGDSVVRSHVPPIDFLLRDQCAWSYFTFLSHQMLCSS